MKDGSTRLGISYFGALLAAGVIVARVNRHRDPTQRTPATLWTSAAQRPADYALSLLGFGLPVVWRVSLLVVAPSVAGGIDMGWTGGPG